MRYTNKVAVVTGAGGGIGEGYAKAFAGEGAAIAVVDINATGAQRVANDINAVGGKAIAVDCDITNEGAVKDMAAKVVTELGGVDVIINNAGLFKDMETYSLLDIPVSYWNKFFDVSMTGALLVTRACVPSMKERGGGAVVNQSSTAAWMGAGAYGIAKLAVNGLTHSLAKELGPFNIRVNAIAPGPTDTEAMRQVPQEIISMIVQSLALPRLAQPEDMADAALFLCSDAARWITGVVLNVDGGQVVRA